jgi:hypothetical protein
LIEVAPPPPPPVPPLDPVLRAAEVELPDVWVDRPPLVVVQVLVVVTPSVGCRDGADGLEPVDGPLVAVGPVGAVVGVGVVDSVGPGVGRGEWLATGCPLVLPADVPVRPVAGAGSTFVVVVVQDVLGADPAGGDPDGAEPPADPPAVASAGAAPVPAADVVDA